MVSLHGLFFFQRGESLAQNLGRSLMRRHDDSVVHPLSFSPRCYDAGPAQIGEMPRNLGLWVTENLDEI